MWLRIVALTGLALCLSAPVLGADCATFVVKQPEERSFYARIIGPLMGSEEAVDIALISGVSSYKGMNDELEAARNDIENLEEYLKSGDNVDYLIVIKEANFTNEQMRDCLVRYIPELLEKHSKSRFLYLHTGHGHAEGKSGSERGYLMTANSSSVKDRINSVRMTDLKSWLGDSVERAHHSLVLINSCFSGSFFAKPFASPVDPKILEPGAHAITSSSANQLSFADEDNSGSTFFNEFLSAVTSRAADSNKDGIVTVLELSAFMEGRVAGQTVRTGWLREGNGSYYFPIKKVDDPSYWRSLSKRSPRNAYGLADATAAQDGEVPVLEEPDELEEEPLELPTANRPVMQVTSIDKAREFVDGSDAYAALILLVDMPCEVTISGANIGPTASLTDRVFIVIPAVHGISCTLQDSTKFFIRQVIPAGHVARVTFNFEQRWNLLNEWRTVVDTQTSLNWQQSDGGKDVKWHEARETCDGMNYDKEDRWRLPSASELVTLYLQSGMFRNPCIDNSQTSHPVYCAVSKDFTLRSHRFWTGDWEAGDHAAATVDLLNNYHEDLTTFDRPDAYDPVGSLTKEGAESGAGVLCVEGINRRRR